MDFDFSEQALLKGTIERFIADECSPEQRRRDRRLPEGYSRESWALLADLGLLGLSVPGEFGGFGGGASEIYVAFETFGRGLCAAPLLGAVLTAGKLIEFAAADDQRQLWLPRLIDGSCIAAVAHAEASARFNLTHVATKAVAADGGYQLSGRKSFVPDSGGAGIFVVSAREAGAVECRDGFAFFLVPADTPGVLRRDYRLADGSLACELDFQSASLPSWSRLPGGMEALELAIDWTTLGIASELLGLMSLLIDTTLDYVRTRRQFGTPIGSFQAIQHRLVDLYVALEQSRSLVLKAVGSDPADVATWRRRLAGAKAYASEAALKIGEESIQLHGGMGVTDELVVGHAYKRIKVLSTLFGIADDALRRRQSPGP